MERLQPDFSGLARVRDALAQQLQRLVPSA